jgi:hypothetical protein
MVPARTSNVQCLEVDEDRRRRADSSTATTILRALVGHYRGRTALPIINMTRSVMGDRLEVEPLV